MKKIVLIFLFLGTVLKLKICEAHWDAAYFHEASDGFTRKTNWMENIRDDVQLSEIAMPGTHDSAAFFNGLIDSAKTQCLSIDEQLNYGVRVFDIRVKLYTNVFNIFHGNIYLKLNFEDFLTSIDSFLDNNPSETILFRLKEEEDHNTQVLNKTLETYLERYPKYLKPNPNRNGLNIELSQARGRFIIFGNSLFDNFVLDYSRIDTQDNYHLRTNWDLYGKWMNVRDHLSKASYGDKNQFYMNYLSGSGGSFPYFVASGHVSSGTGASRLLTGRTTPGWKGSWVDFPRVSCVWFICSIAFEGTNVLTRNRIQNIGGWRTVGIIMADFPGESLLAEIIANNKPLYKK